MSKIIFDSSAILALLKMEEGHDIVTKRLDDTVVSSVNFCEVVTVLSKKGFGQEQVIKFLQETFLHIEDFNTKQAIIAASFDEVTKVHGLSLGDRACLALAKYKNLPVLTADKVWKELKVGVEVHLIR